MHERLLIAALCAGIVAAVLLMLGRIDRTR